MSLESHREKVVRSEDQIQDRVTQIASQINHDFKAVPDPPIIIGVATGAIFFLADLVRIQLPISVDLIRAQSYGSNTLSNGAPSVSLDLKLNANGKHVILVEEGERRWEVVTGAVEVGSGRVAAVKEGGGKRRC